MSTIKSSDEHLTINADGSGKEVKIQRDGTEVLATTSSGVDVTGSVTTDTLTVASGSTDFLALIQNSTSSGNGLKIIAGDNSGDRVLALYDKDENEKVRFPATGGITFNGDTSSSNALDDYEEGTWTPTDASNAGLSLSVNSATYVKIGNTCLVQLYLVYPSNSSASNALIGSLPFTVKTGSYYYAPGRSGFTGVNMQLNNGNTNGYLYKQSSDSIVTNANLSGAHVLVSGVFIVQ